MSPNGEGQARHVQQSIVSTPEEVVLAAQLLDATRSEDEVERQAALGRLATLERNVSLREQGREAPMVPADPELAGPVIAGLEKFTEAVGYQLQTQLDVVTGARNRWLVSAVSAAAVAFLAPIVMMLVGEISTPRLGLVAMSVASAVVGGILSFRVFQSTDETSRRLQEKQVSLAFLKTALDLIDAAPSTQSVLERSFDMFFKHYEGTHSPVSVADLWPTIGTGSHGGS